MRFNYLLRISVVIDVIRASQFGIECPPVPVAPESRHLVASTIRSPAYVEQTRSTLLSQNQFNLLASRYLAGFEGVRHPPSNAETVLILEGNFEASATTSEGSKTVKAGPSLPDALPPIPETDVIRTDLAGSLKQLVDGYWDRLAGSQDGSVPALSDALLDSSVSEFNSDLFLILAQADQMSSCQEMQCVLWSVLLRKIHYRMLLSEVDSNSLELSLLDVLTAMSLVRGDLRTTDGEPQVTAIAPLVVAAIPFILQAGCWCIGQCIRWYMATTSTTTPEPTTTVDPLIAVRKAQRLNFFSSANQNIDSVASSVRGFKCANQEEFISGISAVRISAIEKLTAVASVVGKIAAISQQERSDSFDATELTRIVLTIISSLSGVSRFEDWPATQQQVALGLGEVRSELFEFALATS